MTVESHHAYEAVPATRRRINTRRRLVSAPTVAGEIINGKGGLSKSIIKVIPSAAVKKPSHRMGSLLSINGLRSEAMPKRVIIKRVASGTSFAAANISSNQRGMISLQSVTRELPLAESASDLRARPIDSPHGSLSHSEVNF